MISRGLRLEAGGVAVVMSGSRVSVCGRRFVVAAAQRGGQLRVQVVGAHKHVGIQNGLFLYFVLCKQHLHEIAQAGFVAFYGNRSEEHTSELQSLMRISYAVFCLKKKKY